MNTVQPISTPQTLIFIPRQSAETVVLSLFDEMLETTTEHELSAIYQDGYMEVEISHDFKEGHNYSYQVQADGNLLYRGKIFSTSQTDLQNYRSNPDLLYI